MSAPTCDTCMWFETTSPGRAGKCHLEPPVVVVVRRGGSERIEYHHPVVPPTGFCSNHDSDDEDLSFGFVVPDTPAEMEMSI